MSRVSRSSGVPTGDALTAGRSAAGSIRRHRRWHPDLDAGMAPPEADLFTADDFALDFVDMARVVDRLHAAFVSELREH